MSYCNQHGLIYYRSIVVNVEWFSEQHYLAELHAVNRFRKWTKSLDCLSTQYQFVSTFINIVCSVIGWSHCIMHSLKRNNSKWHRFHQYKHIQISNEESDCSTQYWFMKTILYRPNWHHRCRHRHHHHHQHHQHHHHRHHRHHHHHHHHWLSKILIAVNDQIWR